jgi:Tol biopolymer transport system component
MTHFPYHVIEIGRCNMKKTVYLLAFAFGLLIVLSPDTAAQKAQSAEVLLGAALHQEEVEGNLEAAIETYKKLLAEYPDNRPLAAQAAFRIGMCYERLGRREAQKAYEEVLAKYTDQAEFAAKARERLAALQTGSPAAVPEGRETNLIIRRIPKLDMYAKPSPDGKYFAYVDWETGNLAIQDTLTGATRLLTKDGSLMKESGRYAGFCAWSEDSKRIAYFWDIYEPKQSHTELRVVSLEGDSPPVTIALPESEYPSWVYGWSRDGSRIFIELSGDRGRTSEMAWIDLRSNKVEKANLELFRGAAKPGQIQTTGEEDIILYHCPARGAGTPLDIYRGNLKTGESSAIVEHPAEDLLVGVLPGTDWLLFASDRRGRLDLWGVPLRQGKTGGPPVLVKQGIGRFFPLGFTNGGRYYYATLSVTDDVFFADFDPDARRVIGEPRKLASPWEGTNMGPSFSPDGKHLAYITKRGPIPTPVHSADSLVVQSLDNPDDDPVVFGFGEFHLGRVEGPQWVAGGKSIVLWGEMGDSDGLYRVDLAGPKKEKIYSSPAGHRISGHECADKNSLVYLIDSDAEQAYSILRIDSNGGNERQLFRAPDGQRIYGIALSPDEKTLAIITRLDSAGRALMVMPAEGGTPRRVHEFKQPSGGGVSLAWALDGLSMFFIIKEEEEWTWGIHRIPAEGGDTSETVIKLKGPIYGLRFHPNGRMLTYVGRNGASSDCEVWVMENLKDELKKLAAEAVRREPAPRP